MTASDFLPALRWLALAAALPLAAPVHAEPATDLTFAELFQLPVGPTGLTPQQRLLQLRGQPVRMSGYRVGDSQTTAGVFILAPRPLALGDADESLADDLPAAVVFVHGVPAGALPATSRRVRISGLLDIGARDEADGRVSALRLLMVPGRDHIELLEP